MLVKNRDFPVFPNVFNDFFKDWSNSNGSVVNSTIPAVNIKETENEFFLDVAAPGMDKKDFQINLENDVLTISSEKKSENEETTEQFTRKEYNYLSFKRSFTLPKQLIDRDNIKAIYENGELKITIPKLEEAKPKPTRLIEVL